MNRLLPPLVALVTLLGTWELVVGLLDIEQFLLPRPSAIATALGESFGEITDAALFTLRSVLGGLAFGIVLGVLVALATARFTVATDAALPLAAALNATPIVALAPVMNNWFGLSSPASKIAVVAIIVFFPVMINTVRGLTSVDRGQLELLRSLAATDRQSARTARLPAALPYLFSALRVSASLAVIAAIVSEYFGGPRTALGVFISQRAAFLQFDEVWAAIVVASVIGLGLYSLVTALERICMPWHVSMRNE